MAIEFLQFDAGCKTAKLILEKLTKDPSAHDRAEKLKILISVLTTTSTTLKNLSD